jgi:hypothetical protein
LWHARREEAKQMKLVSLAAIRSAVCVAAAMLAGCGGSQLPISTPVSIPQGLAVGVRQELAVKRSGSTQDYLYISNQQGKVYIYTYPQGQPVASLTANTYSAGECADSNGNVFVTTANGQFESTIYEYAHGGTVPIASLADPGLANACSVDPTTGNLAVANWVDSSNPYSPYKGDVAIYAGAQGSPTMYYSSQYNFNFCGYDNNGNLYLPSPNEHHPDERILVRLAYGSSSFDGISLSKTIYNDSSVQWDGTYMTVSSNENTLGPISLYRLRITGSDATVVGTTVLSNLKNRHEGQIWIQGDTASGVDYRGHRNVSLWAYPKGGKPTYTIKKIGNDRTEGLYGVTVSVAPSQ